MEKALPPLSFFVTIFVNLLPLLPVVTSFLNDPQPNDFKIIVLAAILLITFLSLCRYNGLFNYMSIFLQSFENVNPLSSRLTKWPNTLKQFVGNFLTNCLCVFGPFVELSLKGISIVFLEYIYLTCICLTYHMGIFSELIFLKMRWKFQNYYLWSFSLKLPPEKMPYSILSLLCL